MRTITEVTLLSPTRSQARLQEQITSSPTAGRVELTVVIPAFNEARRLGKSLDRIISYLQAGERSYEVLVVDDGSRDATLEVAAHYQAQGVRTIRLPQNRGKGAAVRTGVLSSSGRQILICDADLSTPINELPHLEKYLPTYGLIVGSREADTADVRRPQPRLRKWLGRAFNVAARCAAVPGIRDTQCGFKLVRASEARQLFKNLMTDGFAFDVELLWLARRAGIAIAEVGVEWHDDRASRVNAWRDGPRMLFEILRFRLHHSRQSRR